MILVTSVATTLLDGRDCFLIVYTKMPPLIYNSVILGDQCGPLWFAWSLLFNCAAPRHNGELQPVVGANM